MTGRWVLRWKIIDGKKQVKARLVIRGFMDQQQGALDTASFTARRSSQRLVLSVAVQHSWALFSWDIGNAFLRGLSFAEISEQGANDIMREACLDPPQDVYSLLQSTEGFRGTSKHSHLLKLLKGAYGLKDAPKLWKKRLDKFLSVQCGGMQSMIDGCIWLWFENGKLIGCISTHIDDLKGCGIESWQKKLYELLVSEFGKVSQDYKKFEHCGIMHEQHDDFTISITQDHYIKELKPIVVPMEMRKKPEQIVDDALHAHFLALQGALGWCLNTRHDIAVYVGALQRHELRRSTT